MSDEVRLCAEAALRYYLAGYQPLPSQPDGRKPAMRRFKSFLTTSRVGEGILGRWWTRNVQIVCGVRWNLIVVDLDGALGALVWDHWVQHYGGCAETWQVKTRHGVHLWFTPPPSVAALPKRRLWEIKGQRGVRKGQGIDLLGDRSLALAPPSQRGDFRYQWMPGHTPEDMDYPALLPCWVIDLAHRPVSETAPFRPRVPAQTGTTPPAVSRVGRRNLDRRTVASAIPPADKVFMARQWGLRIVGEPDPQTGWALCRAIDREDRNPSAGFNVNTGYYSEPGKGERHSLFSLAELLGAYRSWRDAVDDLGTRYGVTERKRLLYRGAER